MNKLIAFVFAFAVFFLCNGTGSAQSGFMEYDHILFPEHGWSISKNTKILTQFELRNEVWREVNLSEGTKPDDESYSFEANDNFNLKKVYAWHKFANKHELSLGLMEGGTWGTGFQDTESDVYRVRYDAPINLGTFIAALQKVKEQGDGDSVSEDNNDDVYILGFIAKIANVYAKPLLIYRQLEDRTADIYEVDLAFNGNFGDFGFEAELGMINTNWDTNKVALTVEDSTTYGAYMNVWHDSGTSMVGVLGAYGSFDKSDDERGGIAHGFGDDFDGGGALLLGDTITFYDDKKGGGDSLAGSSLFALYGNYDISDKFNISGYAGYARCLINIPNDKWNGASAWELSFNAAYELAPNMKYDLGAGLAQLEWGDSTADPDKAYKLFHKLTVGF